VHRPDSEKKKRLRQRNWAVAIALVAFVAIVYAITIVKLQGGA
jgi:uncharacterized membrane protein YhaH (DUF805 family)